jgi:hypothetical protein
MIKLKELLESNKAVEFFKQHPEMLSNLTKGIAEKPGGLKSIPSKNSDSWNQWGDTKEIDLDRLKMQFKSKLKKLGISDQPIRYLTSTVWQYSGIKKFAQVNSKFFNNNDKLIIQDKFEEIDRLGKIYEKVYNQISSQGNSLKLEKELAKLGLSVQDVKTALSYVLDFTSQSYKTLDPKIWDVLRKLTVSDKMLPKFVYRGLFIDGDKIEDQEKFEKNWSVGSSPGVKLLKASSWSASKATAIDFMPPQKHVTNLSKGYGVLLKWQVDPKFVIADFRNLPIDAPFWNQQEIVVSPEITNYTVENIFSGSDTASIGAEWNKIRSSVKKSIGLLGRGKTKRNSVIQLLTRPFSTLSANDKIEFKEICKLTVREYCEKMNIPTSNFEDYIIDKSLPLLVVSKMLFRNTPYKVSEVKNNNSKEIDFTYYEKNPHFERDKSVAFNLDNFNLSDEVDAVTSNDSGKIQLVSDDFYNIRVKIVLPKSFSIQHDSVKSPVKDLKKFSQNLVKILESNLQELQKNYFKSAPNFHIEIA